MIMSVSGDSTLMKLWTWISYLISTDRSLLTCTDWTFKFPVLSPWSYTLDSALYFFSPYKLCTHTLSPPSLPSRGGQSSHLFPSLWNVPYQYFSTSIITLGKHIFSWKVNYQWTQSLGIDCLGRCQGFSLWCRLYLTLCQFHLWDGGRR